MIQTIVIKVYVFISFNSEASKPDILSDDGKSNRNVVRRNSRIFTAVAVSAHGRLPLRKIDRRLFSYFYENEVFSTVVRRDRSVK